MLVQAKLLPINKLKVFDKFSFYVRNFEFTSIEFIQSLNFI